MPILSYFPGGGGGEVTVTVPTLPSQSGALTYTGGTLTPEWSNYDPETLSVSGILSAVNAGSYMAVFVPRVGYCWEDLSVDPREVSWTISKANGSSSASVSSIYLDIYAPSSSFTVTRLGDGLTTAVSSDTSVASVTVNGETVTVTAVGAGTANITISVGEGSNHAAPSDIKVEVTSVCTWKKYSATSSTTHELWIPSQELTLEEIEDMLEADELDPKSDCDSTFGGELTAQSGIMCYNAISVDENGDIVGETKITAMSNAGKINYIREGYAEGHYTWYWVAEKTAFGNMAGYGWDGDAYCFELSVQSTTTYSKGEYIEDVVSTDESAYHDNGMQDGYWYVKVGDISVSDDGNGNVTLLGAFVADDGDGNLIITKGE